MPIDGDYVTKLSFGPRWFSPGPKCRACLFCPQHRQRYEILFRLR